MSFSASFRGHLSRVLPAICLVFLLVSAAQICSAATIRGVVTDTSGATVAGATVSLVSNGSVVNSARSASDGSFSLAAGTAGRFFLVVSASSFRQLETPDFYAGALDNVERTLVLEPEWARQSIVVTATGTPTPQAQTSESTNVLSPQELEERTDLISSLRLMPGTVMVQSGQMGAQSSLFVRGGNSDANKVLLDGVDAGDLGGQFDFGNLSTTALERVEVFRGANSSIYGADAGSSVISITTPHGTTDFPSLFLQGDGGNFNTSHEEAEVAGAHNSIDYLAAYSWLQTGNALPNDEHHLATMAANVGWQPSAATQIRGTLHYGIASTGVPNAWDFYHIADSATEKDQDFLFSGSAQNQTTADFHNSFRYGATRRREQFHKWAQRGSGFFDAYKDSLGDLVTITGANGYSVTGRAVLDYAGKYPTENQLVSNRDQFSYQGDYRFSPHLTALIGYHYEDERGSEPNSTYYSAVERKNSDYIAGVHGDFKGRLFYTLGGSLEHYSLFGTQTSPRIGLAWNAVRQRHKFLSGTRVLFNFGDAVREPKLTDQDDSLYKFLVANGGQSTIQQLHITPIAAPTTRTYEGGVTQGFFSDRIVLRATYFHNQFGKEIEYVGLDLIPQLLPNLTPAQQQTLETFLRNNFAYELTINSEAFRAQGLEATVEGGIGSHLFLRGGYTYLDAVVQRSFTNSDLALLGPIPTFKNGIPIGPYSPLVGARPFRRPPHTGFFTATYAQPRYTAQLSAAFASRSDDSTYLEYSDQNGGNSLLMPNRNLDYGYAKVDLGGSYQILPWLDAYGQAENLMSNQHIAPIGYPSLPFNFRAGLKVALGKESNK